MKDGILSFDERVLEFFAPILSGSTRHHVEHLDGIGLAKGLMGVKLGARWSGSSKRCGTRIADPAGAQQRRIAPRPRIARAGGRERSRPLSKGAQ